MKPFDEKIVNMAASPAPEDANVPVVIRVEIERMRSQLYHMVSSQMAGVDKRLKDAVDRAVREFNFDSQFYEAVDRSVNDEVNRRVGELVRGVMAETFQNENFRSKVAKMVVEKLTKY